MNARTRPCALCSSCGAYSYDESAVNTICNKKIGTSRCDGYWQNRPRLFDWFSCTSCKGTGYIGPKRCKDCQSSGWIPRQK